MSQLCKLVFFAAVLVLFLAGCRSAPRSGRAGPVYNTRVWTATWDKWPPAQQYIWSNHTDIRIWWSSDVTAPTSAYLMGGEFPNTATNGILVTPNLPNNFFRTGYVIR